MSDAVERATKALEGLPDDGIGWMLREASYGYDLCAMNDGGDFAGWVLELHSGQRSDDAPDFSTDFEARSRFIAFARAGIPELRDEVKRLREELARKSAVADAYWEIVESFKKENAELRAVIMTAVAACRSYLPPDGTSADEFISTIIGTFDNPKVNPIIAEIKDAAR